jgi:hypothetical protein
VSLPSRCAALHQRLRCHARGLLFAPHPHTACPSHISSSYFHGSSSKSSLPTPLHHPHQHLDISASTRGTYHPSAFTTPTRTVVVGSRCVYAYDCLPNMRHQTDFLTYHTSTARPTKKFPVIFFWLFSKSTTPSLLALVNRSTPSSSGHPTPRFWLTKRMMEDCGITSCTSSLLPLARQNVNMTDPPPSLTPLSPFSLRFPLRRARMLPIRSFGFAGECLGQHSGSDQEVNLGDGHGYRASTTPFIAPPHTHFPLLSSERNSCDKE